MNNTNGTNPDNRRRDIRTPAQRKAEAERLQKIKSQPKPNPNGNPSAAVKGKSSTANANRNSAPKKTVSRGVSNNARQLEKQQQKLLEQQKQIEILEKQIQYEKQQRSRLSARHRRINELERQLEQQKLIRESLLDKQSEKPNPERSKNLKIAAIITIAVLLIANIIAFAKITQRSIPEKPSHLVNDTQSTAGTENTGNEDTENSYFAKYDKKSVTTSDYINGTLALVNADHTFNFEYDGVDIKDDTLVTVAKEVKNKTFKAADYRIYLNSETVEMLNVMMADFYKESGKNDVMVNSAHRTYEQQQSILESKIKDLGEDQQIAQTPGSSEHHTGYAFDFSIYPDGGVGARTFKNEGAYTWIYENCHKYGFVLRYPEGKTPITQIAPESWHFRYVGVPHATYMYNKGKTLEEYITDISIYTENIPLTIEVSENESYTVFYVPKSNEAATQFNIPKNTEYKISGDNIGGFIVWYKNAETEMAETTPDQASQTQGPNS